MSLVRRLGRLARTPIGIVALAIVLAIALRAPFLELLPFPDEAGLLIVASNWHEGGTNLYGTLFVDRPPLLLLFYQFADALGGIEAARLLGLLAAAVLVGAAGWAGQSIAGRRGTAWGALVAAALIANPAMGTSEINAELVGAPLTMLSCALLLAGLRRPLAPRRRGLLVFAAGSVGAAALLVKQNLLDALVFGVALALAAGLSGAWPWSRTRAVLLMGFLGAAIPVAITLVWAATEGPGLGSLWYTLVQFRIDASGVVATHASPANQARMLALGLLAFSSGLVLLVGIAAAALWRPLRRRDPLVVATTAMVLWEIVGIVGGGSYWPHYLVGLVPGAVLLAADMAAGQAFARRAGVVALVFALASSVVSTGVSAGTAARAQQVPHRSVGLATWLREAHAPGDSGVVLYGNANLLLDAGLRPGSQQLWSLPARTIDPQLLQLNADLLGATPPTWVIQVMPVNTWGLDPEHRLMATLSLSYRKVAEVCGFPVYLHRGVHRILPAASPLC